MRQSDGIIPTSRGWLLMLRVGLLLAACGWGMSFLFTFTSWRTGSYQLYLMGAERLRYDPLLDYWLKMASCVFGCIGIAAGLACWKPVRYGVLVRLLAPFHVIIGCTLVHAAVENHLQTPRHPTFVPDILFCFGTAALIGLPVIRSRY